MPTHLRDRLARIQRFDQLVAFLRDELDWPIGRAHFDDLTFDYAPEELGIDGRNAAKIQEIKRLRPLAPGQPWGVFFVKFAPKRLPVVVLRRILSQVEIKTRPQAHAADRPSWAPDDLLFVSSYGDGDHRQIAFAHFSKPSSTRALPTLKVLNWNNRDTVLHLDDVARKLTEHLSWPDDEDDTGAWREQWRAAFRLRHGEVITTSKALSARLAELARAIRDRTSATLAIESESGPLTKLMKAFRTALLDDLDAGGFADMYAQTIAYGLLSARIADPTRKTIDGLTAHMRTNPFLGELMEAFFHAGGQRALGAAVIDFDELGVSEVVELLDSAKMEAVVIDFGDRNPQEDPVIHFYEDFLAAYDKRQKVESGVFYTPRPVVSYIVRTVDGLLRREFGLEDGFADTTTWGEMAARREAVIPEGVSPGQTFVQILDPATGTGTFLVEVIGLIHRTMVEKWKKQGHDERKIAALWNDYVPRHLLPRLHGYELLMAPYAIAHLKIGLKLHETGYRFESEERAQVYLTNALEPPAKTSQVTMDFLPALAREAEAVGRVKRTRRFTVVIGNPPYLGEAGRGGKWIASLMRGVELPSKRKTLSYFEVDGKPLGEKNPKWLNDLYVRFTRLSQHLIDRAGLGVHGFITNHSYIDNPTFRGMRWALLSAFNRLAVVDLHGNMKKKEVAPDGGRDANVFDIEQGVAIGLFVKSSAGGESGERVAAAQVRHADLWGTRAGKYGRLLGGGRGGALGGGAEVEPRPGFFLLKPFAGDDAYGRYWSIKDVMPVNGVGMTTARDRVVIDFDRRPLLDRAREFRDSTDSDEDLCRRLGIPLKKGWSVPKARMLINSVSDLDAEIKPVLYRPFDQRLIFYHDSLVWRTVKKIMGHMLAGENYAIISARSNKFPKPNHFFCSCTVVETKCGEASTQSTTFPLYLYPGVSGRAGELLFSPWPKGKDGRRPNLDPGFIERLARATALRFVPDGSGDLHATFGPEDVLAYIYAVFHSPGYREYYEAELKLDFPRVPLPGSAKLGRELTKAGHDLLSYHLMESPNLDYPLTDYAGPRDPRVGRVGWSNGTVWLDAAKTNARQRYRAVTPGQYGFHGVPEDVWDFQIGGYQVCHKWLKDRKGRTLSRDDIVHYQKIVVAVSETITIMVAIDGVIDHFGGWPGAFQGERESAGKAADLAQVAESQLTYEPGGPTKDADG